MEIQPSKQTSFASDTSADAESGSARATDPLNGPESCWNSWPCLAVSIIPCVIFAVMALAPIRTIDSVTVGVLLGIIGSVFVAKGLLISFLILIIIMIKFWRSCASESVDSETGQIS